MDASEPSPDELEESPSLFREEPNYWSSFFSYESYKEPENLEKDEGTVDLENNISEEISDNKARKKLEREIDKYQLKKIAYQSAYLKKLEKEGKKLERKYLSLQKATAKKQEKEKKAVANVPAIQKPYLFTEEPQYIPLPFTFERYNEADILGEKDGSRNPNKYTLKEKADEKARNLAKLEKEVEKHEQKKLASQSAWLKKLEKEEKKRELRIILSQKAYVKRLQKEEKKREKLNSSVQKAYEKKLKKANKKCEKTQRAVEKAYIKKLKADKSRERKLLIVETLCTHKIEADKLLEEDRIAFEKAYINMESDKNLQEMNLDTALSIYTFSWGRN